ncbi:hypothetical protein L9F63_006082 [Diploptera punctata]|uniref:Uncharacterized protein n=1 Tax=Diploptera punctata TaxID=6984 RepID=A0AAD7ZB75_DIPPU|nr:hypothetical protein L9F63_006082 [Diploptera punctata]
MVSPVGTLALTPVVDAINQKIMEVVQYVGDMVTETLKAVWEWFLNLFKKPELPNIFVAGGPKVSDQISYKYELSRTTRDPYIISHRLEHESQIITGISVLPLNKDVQAPEVEILEGGINWRDVKLRLTVVGEGRWACHIQICGTPPPKQ